jgi:hypothetical protein
MFACTCTLTIIQIGTILALYPAVPNFVEKYPKIKYTIFDRPPNLALDLCEESFKRKNGLHRNLKILNGQKIRFNKKQTFKVICTPDANRPGLFKIAAERAQICSPYGKVSDFSQIHLNFMNKSNF